MELEYQARQADRLVDKIEKLRVERETLCREARFHARIEQRLGEQLYLQEQFVGDLKKQRTEVGSKSDNNNNNYYYYYYNYNCVGFDWDIYQIIFAKRGDMIICEHILQIGIWYDLENK